MFERVENILKIAEEKNTAAIAFICMDFVMARSVVCAAHATNTPAIVMLYPEHVSLQHTCNLSGYAAMVKELKSIFGYLAYLAKGAEMLPRVKPIKMRMTYDEGVYEGNASMFFLGLTNSVGGFEQIVPDAKLDDGKFSLIIVKTANIFEILHLVALMLNGGKHVEDHRLIYTKTSYLHAETLEKKKLHAGT